MIQSSKTFKLNFVDLEKQYLFSGLMLGWASMVYIMKEEKFFAELCENQNSTINASTSTVDQCIDLEKTLGCPEQDAQFNVSAFFRFAIKLKKWNTYFSENFRRCCDNVRASICVSRLDF